MDTYVLLEVLTDGEAFVRQSRQLLESYKAEGQPAVSEALLAEASSQFAQVEEMERFLAEAERSCHRGGTSSVTSSLAHTCSAKPTCCFRGTVVSTAGCFQDLRVVHRVG